VKTRVRVSDEVPVGDGPTNRLATSAEIDPVGTTPNRKLVQVRIGEAAHSALA
jgi:hypothetical protein